MIAWQAPGAFVALLALAAPITIHLLRRRRATRILFPSDRFVRPSVTGAVRLRLPSDAALLVLRCAIVAAAVCALAQPVVVSRARVRAWNARVARAVVVDVSASMKGVAEAAAAAAAAAAELRSAAHGVRIESADLADGIRRAAASLGDAPPARREIVVISDFQTGALAAPVPQGVPESSGVRFVRVGRPPGVRQAVGPVLLPAGGRSLRAEIAVRDDRTSVSFVDAGPESRGLTIDGATDDERERLLAAVASSGAPAPDPSEPTVVRFGRSEGRNVGRSEGRSAGRSEGERWMLETALRLRTDPELAAGPASSSALRVGASGAALAIDVDADPGSFAAAAAVRGVLAARHGSPVRALAEHEVWTITDGDLRAWSRDAPDVTADIWRHAAQTDARWFWALALLLLGVEAFVRTRGAA